jgi:hypothetical protein
MRCVRALSQSPQSTHNPRFQIKVGLIVAVIGVALYPTVVVPLQIAYGGRERPARDPALAPAFSKKGACVWSVLVEGVW